MKKIKPKEDALLFLDNLIINCQEIIFFQPSYKKQRYVFAMDQLIAMKNSINHSQDFFEGYFKDKSGEQILQWIEKEAKKWQM